MLPIDYPISFAWLGLTRRNYSLTVLVSHSGLHKKMGIEIVEIVGPSFELRSQSIEWYDS